MTARAHEDQSSRPLTAPPANALRRRIGAVLERVGVGDAEAIVAIAPLTGGVSSDVFKVRTRDRELCVKFAVEQLRVAGTWRAPLRRSAAEFAWLSFVAQHFPGCVPHILGHDQDQHAVAMAYLPETDFPNWKQQLLDGRVDESTAASVGRRLAAIHAVSAHRLEIAAAFDNGEDFEALRIDPYLRATGERHPALIGRLDELAQSLRTARTALVHGDVSPKNILCGPNGPVFIDAECATFGDPAFDVAFVLTHLTIKAIVRPSDRATLRSAAMRLWLAYRERIIWEPPAQIDGRAARLLPALMLARVDGKSPLEYLTARTGDHVRSRALAMFAGPRPDLASTLEYAATGVMH